MWFCDFFPNHNKHRKVLAEPEPLWSLYFRQSITADLDSKGNNSNGWISRKKNTSKPEAFSKTNNTSMTSHTSCPPLPVGHTKQDKNKDGICIPQWYFLSQPHSARIFIFCFLFVKICGLKICGVYVLNNNFQLYGAIKEKEDLLRANCTELHEP